MKKFSGKREPPSRCQGQKGALASVRKHRGLVLHEHRGRLRLLEAEEGAGDKLLRIRCASVRPERGMRSFRPLGGADSFPLPASKAIPSARGPGVAGETAVGADNPGGRGGTGTACFSPRHPRWPGRTWGGESAGPSLRRCRSFRRESPGAFPTPAAERACPPDAGAEAPPGCSPAKYLTSHRAAGSRSGGICRSAPKPGSQNRTSVRPISSPVSRITPKGRVNAGHCPTS